MVEPKRGQTVTSLSNMADIDGSGYPNDGTSEKDEILTSTKPDSYSAVMEDQAQDSQFEDAESDYTPLHSPVKTPIHAVQDEDSRDSGINHSESGSDRPEKQDLPESQYEDAEMDSNADPEEDNEPIESNGQSHIVDGFDQAKDMHDNGEYRDGDDRVYTENDAPEENRIHANLLEERYSENIISGLDVSGVNEGSQDIPESQPEDESSMLVAVTMGSGDSEEGADRSEEEVVEKYEEEEMHENYADDHYGDESEQFHEEDQFYEPKEAADVEGYVEENGEDIGLQPEASYYAEQTVQESGPTLLDSEVSDLPEDHSVVVPETSEREGFTETHLDNIPNEGSLLHPEAELLVDTKVKEEVKTIVLQKEDLREFESDLLHTDTDTTDTQNFIEQLDIQLNLGRQMHYEHKPSLDLLDSNFEDAPESNIYPEGRHYEEPDNKLISDIDLLGDSVQPSHFAVEPADLDQKIQENLHIIASRSSQGAKTDSLPKTETGQFSDDLIEDNVIIETKASRNTSPQKKKAQETLLDRDFSPLETTPKPVPKTYTNFDDIPVGVAYNYVPPSPNQDDSIEADRDRRIKPVTGPVKKKPQGDVGVRKGRGRGLDKQRQTPQQQGRTGGRGQYSVPKGNVQKMHNSEPRTLSSQPSPSVPQDPRRQPVQSAEAKRTKGNPLMKQKDSREGNYFVPIDGVEQEDATLPKQEVRRTADVPGTAVRVNRQMGQPKTSPPTDPRTTQQQKRPVRMAGQPARRGPVPKSGSAKETMIGTPVTSDMTTAGRGERKSGATENLSGRRDSWDDRRVTSAERLATSGMSPVGREDRNIASQQLVNVQGRQQGNVTNKDYQSSNRQHLSAPSESNQTNDEVPKRPVSPGIARRQPPPPDNISQAQSRRYAEYGTSSHTKSQPKEYEYPESLDLENESRHSSGCTSPYHQPKQSSQAHHHVKESPIKTHSHNGHGFEQTESEHQPVCTCGQVVYDDIAESQAYLIERNKKKVAQRAAELQAKRDEEDKTHRGDSKDEVHLRPTNRRRNSYELANRDISPTQEKDGERYGERFRPDMSGRPATSKKDLEEPATSARRYKLVDIEGVSKDTRDTQLSGLDHAKLAKLAERELADMERSRAVRDRSQQQARQAYATSQVSPKKNPVSPLQGSPKPHSPQKQITSKTASPARSGTSVSSSPTKTLPSQSSSANSPAKSTSSVEGVKKGVAYGQPLYDKTGLRLSGIHSLDLSGDIGQDRPEEDQFMDADESDEEYDSISRDREDSGRYEDADRGDQQIIGEGAITNTMTEIQAAISQSKNMLLKSPTFYVEKEPEEPVWVLRPFYAKKQLQDEERRRQEQERERQREAVRQEQRGHNRSPTSLGSSDDDLHNRNPQGYLRKQESDDEDDDVEQKPLMSTSDYETGSSSHDHIHSEECYLRNPRPRETFQDDEDLPPSGSKTKEVRGPHDPPVLEHGIIYPAGYLGSTQLICNKPPSKKVRMQQAQEAVSRIKTRLWRYSYQAPEGETQPSTDVDIFISTERVKVLNADSEETMMDHPLKTISYIADIGNLLVIMARRRSYATTLDEAMEESGIAMGDQVSALPRGPKKIICHVFETEDAQLIAQSIGQAFSIAYLNFLKENGIDDPSVTEMDYGEVLSSQEIYGDDLMLFSNKECEKEILIEKERGEIMGVVIVESGWGSLVPTVVIANMSPFGAAARSGKLNIGDQIMSINGTSCVGLPLTTAQQNIKSLKNQCLVKFNVVSCPPVTQVIIKRPDVKYQLGFSVQNGTICSLMRGGIAERGGVRVGHRIIEINGMSVVATAHEKIVDILATAVGEIHMKTMPLSMYRLLTGQEQPLYL